MVEYLRSLKPVILVRHGQSTSNVDPQVGGWQDPELTPLGKRQAEAIATRLTKLLDGREVVIYSSHLRRARETAEPICRALNCEAVIEEGLQEYQTNLDPKLSRPEAEQYSNPRTKPARHWRTYQDAESLGELYHRAGEALSRIIEKHNEIIVIVSHGWLIDKMIAWWIDMPVDNITPNMFTTGNASLSVLSITDYGERVLMKLNDTSHLVHHGEQDSFLD